MRILDMFVIICIIAVGMFGLIFISGNSTSPLNVKDTFGNTSIPSHMESTIVINNTIIDGPTPDMTPNLTYITIPADQVLNFTQNKTVDSLHNVTVSDDPNNSYMVSYNSLQNTTAFEVQGAGAGIVILAACVVMIIIFAFIVLSRGKYSKNRYRT